MSGSDGTGMLIVTVEDIIYNPGGTLMIDDSHSSPSGSGRKLQVKKRKFDMMDTAKSNSKSIKHCFGTVINGADLMHRKSQYF